MADEPFRGSGGSRAKDQPELSLDPAKLGQSHSGDITTLSVKDVCKLVGVKKLSLLKYPVYLQFEHKRFLLQDIDFIYKFGDVVKQINLNKNDLVAFSLPELIAKKIKRISLDENQIVTASFNGMSNLLVLSMSKNRLETMPNLNGCKKLVNLNLSKNAICSGFSNLAGLPALEHCDLSDNGLALSLSEVYHYIIAPLRDCTALRSLDLSSNPLCADIQDFDYFLIAHLTALEFVNGRAVTKEQRKHAEKLAKARWSRVGVRTFTASMWPLPPRVEPSLTAIAEQKRSRSEQLPVYVDGSSTVSTLTPALLSAFFLESLEDLTYPICLSLASDVFQLETAELLSKAMGDVLAELDLSHNRLSVLSLHTFTKLRRLFVAHNQLRSLNLDNLTSLLVLDVSHNALRHIPTGGDARRLSVLLLSHNRIVHGFDQLPQYRALTQLDLSYNELALSVSQLYHYLLLPLKRCASLQRLNLVGNEMLKSVPQCRLFIIHELPWLRWLNNGVVTHDERAQAADQARLGVWKDKMLEAAPLSAIEAATNNKSKRRQVEFDVPKAMNLLAQIEADDMTLRPLEALRDEMIEPFVLADPDSRIFIHEPNTEVDESLGSLLHTFQRTSEKALSHRLELMKAISALCGVENGGLASLSVQIINVLLLTVEPDSPNRQEFVTALVDTCSRLLAPHYHRSVHACASRSLAALVPYHDDVAVSCSDEPLLVGALVRTLPERSSPAEAQNVLGLLCDLGMCLLKRDLPPKERSDVLLLYALPTLLDEALSRADAFGQPLVRRFADLCLLAAQHDPETCQLQSDPQASALVSSLRDSIALAYFSDAALLAAQLVSGNAPSSGNSGRDTGTSDTSSPSGMSFLGDIGVSTPAAQAWVRNYATLGFAFQRVSQCAVWLDRRNYGDSLSAILCSSLTPNPPTFELFQVAAKALALLLHDTPGAPHRLSVKHAHLSVLCMRLLQAKSEDRERLVLRWRRMGATAVAIEQLDQGHFDSLCEVLVWLTQHTPKNDTGPSTQKRNAVLEDIVTARPTSHIGELITDVFEIEPRKGILSRVFGL